MYFNVSGNSTVASSNKYFDLVGVDRSASIAGSYPSDSNIAASGNSLWWLHLSGNSEVRDSSNSRERSISTSGLSTDLEEVLTSSIDSGVSSVSESRGLSKTLPSNSTGICLAVVPVELISVTSVHSLVESAVVINNIVGRPSDSDS